MAGIVKANAATPMLAGPLIDRDSFGALHVGFESAKPEQAGRRALPHSHRNAAGRATGSQIERFKADIDCHFHHVYHGNYASVSVLQIIPALRKQNVRRSPVAPAAEADYHDKDR